MAHNKKAKENEIVTNGQVKESSENLTSNLLTEDEQLEFFAKLIIDIYFDQENENEKLQQHAKSSA